MHENDGVLNFYMSKNKFFVSGIGTGVGKTIISAILCEALEADYWKPVQSGDADNSDSMMVQSLISNSNTVFHPERHVLTQPLSPHAAAEIDGVRISPRDFHLPTTERALIVEGAGGLMVPLNENYLMIDLMEDLHLPVILVSRNYLGSINHTLLSIEALRLRDVHLAGIIFNGDTVTATETVIEHYTGVPVIGRIPEEKLWDKAKVAQHAAAMKGVFS